MAYTSLHDIAAAAGDEKVGSRVRSRAGRLLKPVTRLIEIMHQKTGVFFLDIIHLVRFSFHYHQGLVVGVKCFFFCPDICR